MLTVLGIDPGLTGAIAVYDLKEAADGETTMRVFDMPVAVKPFGKGNEVDAPRLACTIDTMRGPDCVAYLEHVQAMPPIRGARRSAGTVSSLSFGDSGGVVRGVLAGLNIETHRVRPQSWKAKAGLIGKEKDAARALALDLYPTLAESLKRKKDIGRADAILIAHFSYCL